MASTSPTSSQDKFDFPNIARLGLFQIGSAMGDILGLSVWNRIMVKEIGVSATIVALLVAIRYLAAPISLWAGSRSDSIKFLGKQRVSYIWVGRFIIVCSLPFVGLSVARLSQDSGDLFGWISAVLFPLLYGIGKMLSGGPFLALVRDSYPKSQQGLAASVIETILISLFPIVSISFGIWMDKYDLGTFWQMIFFVMAVGGFFWWFAVAGAESRNERLGFVEEKANEMRASIGVTYRKIWEVVQTRQFFWFLIVSTTAAWMQESVLEIFGADIWDMSVGETTRLGSVWQLGTLVVLVVGGLLWRRRAPQYQSNITSSGLFFMAIGLFVVAFSAMSASKGVLYIGLLIFGSGFGAYTFGAFSLMVVMATDKDAGAYLGLWTFCILVFRGVGIFLGGVLRDVFFTLFGDFSPTYATLFAIQGVGLLIGIMILRQIDVIGFAKIYGRE